MLCSKFNNKDKHIHLILLEFFLVKMNINIQDIHSYHFDSFIDYQIFVFYFICTKWSYLFQTYVYLSEFQIYLLKKCDNIEKSSSMSYLPFLALLR